MKGPIVTSDFDYQLEGALLLLSRYRPPYRQPTPTHLKIGPVNFYPSSGRVHCDGLPHAETGRGLDTLERCLRRIGALPPLGST